MPSGMSQTTRFFLPKKKDLLPKKKDLLSANLFSFGAESSDLKAAINLNQICNLRNVVECSSPWHSSRLTRRWYKTKGSCEFLQTQIIQRWLALQFGSFSAYGAYRKKHKLGFRQLNLH
jgi:hypothetical protein